jgi:hypothetical protein
MNTVTRTLAAALAAGVLTLTAAPAMAVDEPDLSVCEPYRLQINNLHRIEIQQLTVIERVTAERDQLAAERDALTAEVAERDALLVRKQATIARLRAKLAASR